MAPAVEYDFVENRFGPWDYVVFAALLAISSVIGLYYGCTGNKQSSTSEFLMAGRSMGIFPVALSLLASFMSAITLLGTPAVIAVEGTQYWMIGVSYCFVIPLASYVFVPVFYDLNLTSVFEYLELRFSKGVRVYTCIVYMVYMIFYMALVLYAPCLALSVVTGLNKWIAVFSVGVVCTFYTTVGGMKAVMWTDVVQIFLMFAGMIAIIIKGSVDSGGFSEIWTAMYNDSRIEFFNFDPDPLTRHTFWSLIIGGTFTWLAIYGVNQAQVQRALCTPTCKQGQIAMWINLPGLATLLSVCALCGMVVYYEYRHCNPITAGRIQAQDQLLPLYVMDKLHYPGFPGFFTACIFSGGLSTISSGLNSLAAVCLQDLLRGLWWKDISESQATLASKIISVAFGAIMIALTFLAAQMGNSLLQAALGLFGMIGGPILGVFILGLIYPWANYKGAHFGLTVSLVLTLWLGIGAIIYRPSFQVRGNVPPPMNLAMCPLKMLGNETGLENITESSYWDPNVTATSSSFYASTELTTTIAKQEPAAGFLDFYQMSYMWYSAFAVFVATVAGLIFSFLTGYTRTCDVDPRLLCPIFDIFCCFLPPRLRRWLRCNIEPVNECKEVKLQSVIQIVPNGNISTSNGTKLSAVSLDDGYEGYVNRAAIFDDIYYVSDGVVNAGDKAESTKL